VRPFSHLSASFPCYERSLIAADDDGACANKQMQDWDGRIAGGRPICMGGTQVDR
jgi:hypothetical protein